MHHPSGQERARSAFHSTKISQQPMSVFTNADRQCFLVPGPSIARMPQQHCPVLLFRRRRAQTKVVNRDRAGFPTVGWSSWCNTPEQYDVGDVGTKGKPMRNGVVLVVFHVLLVDYLIWWKCGKSRHAPCAIILSRFLKRQTCARQISGIIRCFYGMSHMPSVCTAHACTHPGHGRTVGRFFVAKSTRCQARQRISVVISTNLRADA